MLLLRYLVPGHETSSEARADAHVYVNLSE
jgi:hypothetical protein